MGLIFNGMAMVAKIIGGLQNYLKTTFNNISAMGSQFPMTLTIQWIALGVVVQIKVDFDGINAGVLKVNELESLPTEYQERIAECESIINSIMENFKKRV